jgi:hypothetical protein
MLSSAVYLRCPMCGIGCGICPATLLPAMLQMLPHRSSPRRQHLRLRTPCLRNGIARAGTARASWLLTSDNPLCITLLILYVRIMSSRQHTSLYALQRVWSFAARLTRATSTHGVRSTSSDATPSPSAHVDRRWMLTIIGLLLSGPRDPGVGDASRQRRRDFPPVCEAALQAYCRRDMSLYADYCNTILARM